MLDYQGIYSYYLALMFSLWGLYLFGHCYTILLKIDLSAKPFISVFSKLFLGLLIGVLLYSLGKSRFVTINILFIPLSIFLYSILQRYRLYEYEIKSLFFKKKEIVILVYCSLFATIIFIVRVLELYDWETGYLYHHELTFDKIFYNNIVDELNILGIENVNGGLNYYDKTYHGLSAYHYFELWLNALIVKLTGLISLYSYSMIASLLLAVVLYSGYLALFEYFNPSISWYVYLLSFGLVLSTAFYFDFYQSLELLKYISRRYASGLTDALSMPKLVLGELFLVSSTLFFLYRKPLAGILSLLFLPIINIGLLPGVLAGCFIFVVFNKFLHLIKLPNNYLLITFILFGLFYLIIIFFFRPELKLSYPDLAIINEITLLGYIKKFFIRITAETLRFSILFLPLLILFAVIVRDKAHLKAIILLNTLILGGGLLFSASIFFFVDSFQFVENFAVSFFKLFIIVLPIAIWYGEGIHKNINTTLAIGIIYIVLFYISGKSFYDRINYTTKNPYSLKFIKEVAPIITEMADNHSYYIGLSLLDADELPTVYTFGVLSEPTLGGYISHIANNSYIINASWYKVLNIYPDKRLDIFINNNPYTMYRKEQLKKYGNGREIYILSKFIRENNIRFITATSKVDIKKEIELSLIRDIFIDYASGEQLIILR